MRLTLPDTDVAPHVAFCSVFPLEHQLSPLTLVWRQQRSEASDSRLLNASHMVVSFIILICFQVLGSPPSSDQ